ncbi:HEAT repeat [Mariniphaga anaerophila]|uniref:HEAT repeat n=1 Tax=Mariniphaga anaerophila TaxID=1484053 RepID=A0A1M5CLW9_9BACT|nr:family 16 glycoside hydrolase [Mariniphaga anaerophila]SHF55785.1 HEAT repeat [Mariniphaga anaerophila]
MNKRIFQFTAILFLALITSVTFAQDRRTLDTKVADALAQMPTKDLVHRDRVLVDLVELGPEGFQKLAQLLTPPGVGDDTAVRFAINSLARYASEFGKENARTLTESGLLAALNEHSDTEVKTFLLNQQNLVGSDKSVDAIKKYLAEADLVEPVTQTLVAIGSEKAAIALYEALPGTDDAAKATLARALGVLRYEPAVRPVTTFASTDNVGLRKVVLAALANIGSPESYNLLLKAAKDVDFKYDPTNAAEAFLEYANRLGEKGELKLCQKALKTIFKANRESGNLHNYSVALSVYAQHFDYEALPLLLKAVENSDKAFRYLALNTAENIGGAAGTRMWIEKATAVPAETKAEIIDMLGRRGDKLAVGFVTESLNDASAAVREDAIEALTRLQGKKAVPVLIDHLEKGTDAEATKLALSQLIDREHLAPVAARLKTTSGATKAAFIDLIAAKSGNGYFSEVLALTGSKDEKESTAAFAALKNISCEKNLDALIKLLLDANEKDVPQVQMAVVAAAKGTKTEQTENGKLLRALKSTGKKERIVAILPEIGGDVALQTVTDYFNNSTGSLKATAFEALTSWKDYSAAASLYEVAENSTGEYRAKAFSNFVRQVRSANLPDDQKLLQYRKIMPFASGAADQKLVINAIGGLKTFLSLVYLEQFLDNNELQQTAARAIMKVALPDADGKNAFSGKIVTKLLKRVVSILKGEESDYDIININNYLDKMPKDEGFVSMFNGKNLEGWQGMLLDGNPIKIAELSAAERAKAQEEANKKMFDNWSVKDGQIIFNGHGANLVSVKEYKDFEMIVDWKITKEGDSGIYLRGTPQVQIWDTSRVEVGAQVGSGGLYNNNPDNIRNPLKVADNPLDDWNTFRITMIGENVTVYLNGELVVDNVTMDNFWNRSIPIFEKGTIELQAHGNELAFRDVYVREINTDEIGLTEEEKNEGFVSLFNGMNLDGWQGNKTDYYAENGELVVQPARGGHGNLFTDKEYGDFIFRFEFQLTPGANNGLGIRAPLEGDAAYAGIELQILDNTAPIYANLKEYQYHGSAYGIIAAKRGYLNPVGEWNVQEVVVKGSKIKVTLNGTVILDGDVAEASKNGTRDGKNHPGLKREKGYIGFLGHGSELKFRNIRLKDLSN